MKIIWTSSIWRKWGEIFKKWNIFEVSHQSEIIGIIMTKVEYDNIMTKIENKEEKNEEKITYNIDEMFL